MHCGFCGTNISELTFFVPSIFASTVMPNFEYNCSCCCSTSYFGFFFLVALRALVMGQTSLCLLLNAE